MILIFKVTFAKFCAKTCNFCLGSSSKLEEKPIKVREPTGKWSVCFNVKINIPKFKFFSNKAECRDNSKTCDSWKDRCDLLDSLKTHPCRFTCNKCWNDIWLTKEVTLFKNGKILLEFILLF